MMRESIQDNQSERPPAVSHVLPDGNGGYGPCPALMTEAELIQFLRIPEASQTKNHHYVIENLKRMRGLPCIHISRTPLYPRDAVVSWITEQTEKGSK